VEAKWEEEEKEDRQERWPKKTYIHGARQSRRKVDENEGKKRVSKNHHSNSKMVGCQRKKGPDRRGLYIGRGEDNERYPRE